jgi:hypothetical protein
MTMRAHALLAAVTIALASPALAEVGACDSAEARSVMIRTLPRAADERPVDVLFRTRAEGVKLPDWLRSEYPDEMSIILQYEFDRLVVKDDRFEVTLWFKRRPARLAIPFGAVKAFYDRSIAQCWSG